MNIRFSANTWVEPEDCCTDYGQFRRKFRAYHKNTRCIVTGKADVADTFFSIPATTKAEHGFLTNDDGLLVFYPHDDQTETPSDWRKAYARRRKA